MNPGADSDFAEERCAVVLPECEAKTSTLVNHTCPAAPSSGPPSRRLAGDQRADDRNRGRKSHLTRVCLPGALGVHVAINKPWRTR
jgi:hypothetical protein